MKKYLVFLLAIVFASCSTTHKTKTESKKTEDSTVVSHVDSTGVSKAQTYTDNFVAQGVDVTFDYGNSTDSATVDPSHPDTISKKDDAAIKTILKDALTATGKTSKLPTSVHIHIDSLGNTSTPVTSTDSTHVKADTKADVKTTDTEKSKVVTRTGAGAGVYIIAGIVVLIGLFFGAKKLKLV